MSIVSVKLKTHSREDLTSDFLFINNCTVHGNKPEVLDIVAGKDKEHHYVVTCGHDECSKISMVSAQSVVDIWNHYNPVSSLSK